MTEAEWLESVDPDGMLRYLEGRVSDRKFRLFACACCRRVRHWLTEPTSRRMLKIAERVADRRLDRRVLDRAKHAADHAKGGEAAVAAWYTGWDDAYIGAKGAAWYAAAAAAGRFADPGAWNSERRRQAFLLREIVGNPFRKVVSPEPGPGALRQLAEAMYAGEKVKPVLQGALRGVGYDRLADHFDKEKHPKGCWALDLILGRE